MLRQFNTRRIIGFFLIDWLGTLIMLMLANWLCFGRDTGSLVAGFLTTLFPLDANRILLSPVAFLPTGVYLLIAVIWPFFSIVFSVYDGRRNESLKAELINVFAVICISAMVLSSILWFTDHEISRFLFFIFFVLDTTLLLGSRIVLWVYRLNQNERPQQHRRAVLVIGAGQVGRKVVAEFKKYAWADIEPIGYVDNNPSKQSLVLEGLPVLGTLANVPTIVSANDVRDAVVALPLDAHKQLVEICKTLQGLGVRVHVIPDLFALSFPSATLDGFGGVPVINLGQPGIYGGQRFSKRAFDVVTVSLGLVVLSPLLLVIAVLIKLESPGPALYKQQRVGEHGRLFTMFKFRSMRQETDSSLHRAHVTRLIQQNIGAEQLDPSDTLKLKNDPRVTRVGTIIRKTSLDELPQLFNVLLGEMSLVGPRPPLPYEVELYEDWHKRRFEAIPGITGLWQVKGRNRVSFDEMVRMDIEYIKNQSFWLDLKLLLQTPYAVITGRGAG